MEYKKIPINIKEKILKEYIAYRTCIICNKKYTYFCNSENYIHKQNIYFGCITCYPKQKKNINILNMLNYFYHPLLIAKKVEKILIKNYPKIYPK